MRYTIAILAIIMLCVACTPKVVDNTPDTPEDTQTEDTTQETPQVTEEVEQDTEITKEETEEEPPAAEPKEPEQPPEKELVPPTLDKFVLDAECTGKMTLVATVKGDVENADFLVAFSGQEVKGGLLTYTKESGWLSVEYSDLERGEYIYELSVKTPNDETVVLKEGTFLVDSCIKILSTVPAEGAENASVKDDVIIEFSTRMDKDSVEDAIYAPFDFTTSWDGNTITLKPVEDLYYNEDYTIEINKRAEDDEGNIMDKDFALNFMTGDIPSPIIKDIDVEELHDDEDDNPYRYMISIDVTDPDELEPLTFDWEIDCGYFYDGADLGQTYSADDVDELEWRFNSSETKCKNADLTVTVTNTEDKEVSQDKRMFE